MTLRGGDVTLSLEPPPQCASAETATTFTWGQNVSAGGPPTGAARFRWNSSPARGRRSEGLPSPRRWPGRLNQTFRRYRRRKGPTSPQGGHQGPTQHQGIWRMCAQQPGKRTMTLGLFLPELEHIAQDENAAMGATPPEPGDGYLDGRPHR